MTAGGVIRGQNLTKRKDTRNSPQTERTKLLHDPEVTDDAKRNSSSRSPSPHALTLLTKARKEGGRIKRRQRPVSFAESRYQANKEAALWSRCNKKGRSHSSFVQGILTIFPVRESTSSGDICCPQGGVRIPFYQRIIASFDELFYKGTILLIGQFFSASALRDWVSDHSKGISTTTRNQNWATAEKLRLGPTTCIRKFATDMRCSKLCKAVGSFRVQIASI